MNTGPVFTELTVCQDCYRCLRQCPVKAIRVRDGKAEVQRDLCLNCGRCLNECPAGAKKIRSDRGRLIQMLALGRTVVASLAPSWVAEFRDAGRLVGDLKFMGFSAVEETSCGAELLVDACTENPDLARGISSACPVIVEYITRYEVDLIPLLSPLVSPLEAHARSIKSRYGSETVVAFIGPCVAKKLEADRPDSAVDIALTFRELREWRDSIGISEEDVLEINPPKAPPNEGECRDFFLEGGFLKALERKAGSGCRIPGGISLSGLEGILPGLKSLIKRERASLPPIELLGCFGGCHNGPGTTQINSVMEKRIQSETILRAGRPAGFSLPEDVSNVELTRFYEPSAPGIKPAPDLRAARAVLASLGRVTGDDDPDCGSCGYDSCLAFAGAVLTGMAEENMCLSVMRRRAQNQSDALMSSLPLGAVIVDRSMKIRECNGRFLRLFTDVDFDPPGNVLNSVRGRDLTGYMEDVSVINRVLTGSEVSFTGNISSRGRHYRATVFPVGGGDAAGAVFQDITSPQVKRETVIRKAEEVIQKSLSSVQQIASLLGENAADTQLILDSLIGAFND